jgi:hypothetical protein
MTVTMLGYYQQCVWLKALYSVKHKTTSSVIFHQTYMYSRDRKEHQV